MSDEEHSWRTASFYDIRPVFHPSGHPEDVHKDLLEQITTASAGLHGR
jgi:hypothetical protein